MRCAVFDLDGTLADTAADLIAAANACFAAEGFSVRLDPTEDAATAFLGGRAMLNAGFTRAGRPLDREQIDGYYPMLLEYYDANICKHTTLYDGALESVVTLRETGWRTAICTNKPEALAIKLVEQLGITDLFGALLGADTLPVRKPDPEHLFETVRRAGAQPARSVLIGDTLTDLATAKAANVPGVLMRFLDPGPDIVTAPPAATLKSYAPLVETLERLVPETA